MTTAAAGGSQDFARYARFVNTSEEVIPPFAVMKVVGISTDGDLQVEKPDRDNDNSGLMTNMAIPVEPGMYGTGAISEPFMIAVGGSGGPPVVGEKWGVRADSWLLWRDRSGFRIMVAATDKNLVLVSRMEFQYEQFIRITNDTLSGGYYQGVERRYDIILDDWVEYDDVLIVSNSTLVEDDLIYGVLAGNNGTHPIFNPVSATGTGHSTTIVVDANARQLPIPMEITASNGSIHAWKEKEQLLNGTLQDKSGGLTGNLTVHFAKEVNNLTTPNGTIVMGFPGYGWNTEAVVGVDQMGNGTVSQVHSLYITSETTGGTFTLSYSVDSITYNTTSALAWDINATTLETAIEAIPGFGNATVTGNGTSGNQFLISHDDDFLNYPPFVADSSELTGAELWLFEYANGTARPSAPNQSVQSNQSGALGGDANFTHNLTTGMVTAKNMTLTGVPSNNITTTDANQTIRGVTIGSGLTYNTTTYTLTAQTAVGNGTSNGGLGAVQYADGFGGFRQENSSFSYNETTNTLRVETLQSPNVDANPNHLSLVTADISGNLQRTVVIDYTDHGAFPYANSNGSGWAMAFDVNKLKWDDAATAIFMPRLRLTTFGAFTFGWLYTDLSGNVNQAQQGTAVADATGAGDVVAQLNALLAELRTMGIIDT